MASRRLSRSWFPCAFALLAAVLSAVFAYGQDASPAISFTFTSFDDPAAGTNGSTNGFGINNAGVIVGSYNCVKNQQCHGFARLPNGTYDNLNYPGATGTQPVHINDSNQVVGYYTDSSNVLHGFQFTLPNTFTPINYPGAAQTQAFGINNSGQVVGEWYDSLGNGFGFSLLNGTYTELVYPNAIGTGASDVNTAGVISGIWEDTSKVTHGFLLSSAVNGTYSEVDYPGAVNTLVLGINDSSQVVGYYIDASKVQHAWAGLPAKNEYITVDYPGTGWVGGVLVGISNAGHLSGGWLYTQNGGLYEHGYLAVP